MTSPVVKDVLLRVATILNDLDHIRWPLPTLLDWLNEGVRAIALAKPSVVTLTQTLALAPGTRQIIPQTGTVLSSPVVVLGHIPMMLVKLVRNMRKVNGVDTPGRSISVIEQAVLDDLEPDWHNTRVTRPDVDVRHYIYDEADRLVFYVYPPNTGTGFVEAVLSAVPAAVPVPTTSPEKLANYNALLPLPIPYDVVLVDYILYRAYLVDDIEGGAQRSPMHFQQFANAIGLKIQVESATTPNVRL